LRSDLLRSDLLRSDLLRSDLLRSDLLRSDLSRFRAFALQRLMIAATVPRLVWAPCSSRPKLQCIHCPQRTPAEARMVSAHGEPPLNHLPQDKRLGRGDVPFLKISIPCGASLSPAAGLFVRKAYQRCGGNRRAWLYSADQGELNSAAWGRIVEA
jgi:hypothetical protein